MSTSPNGLATEPAADPRRKLETLVRTVLGGKAFADGGMLGMMMTSAMPMVTTMLERAAPETVGQYCAVLSQAFAKIADDSVTNQAFAEQLAAWRTE